jgi:hypothetical protein
MRWASILVTFLALVLLGPIAGIETTTTSSLSAQELKLPMQDGSVKFAVLGDTGTGDRNQLAVAKQLIAAHAKFPFEFALLLGDNLYGAERPGDYARKFEVPYKPLLDKGVKFYASLGNHDDPEQRLYKLFNMNGERYYSFKPSQLAGIRFFALDSNYMDPRQTQWLEKELAASGSDWKVAFFHHPPYASGMHGSDEVLRAQIEPIFLKHGVQVVFTGHEHFYERIKPQKGIQYFVAGGSAKLRRGDISRTPLTAFGYDEGLTFMLVEVVGDAMHFQVFNERGQTVDAGVITKNANNEVTGTTGAAPGSKPTGVPNAPAAKPVPETPEGKPAAPTAKPAAPAAKPAAPAR